MENNGRVHVWTRYFVCFDQPRVYEFVAPRPKNLPSPTVPETIYLTKTHVDGNHAAHGMGAGFGSYGTVHASKQTTHGTLDCQSSKMRLG